jgi:purine-cytosine permease-like protein
MRRTDVGVSLNIARAGRKLENVWVITRRFPWVLLACAASLAMAACGSSGSSSPPSPSASPTSAPPASSSPSAAASGNAVAEITANWTTFFSGKTPFSKRITVLQNGSTFASEIQSSSGYPGASSSAEANVTYDILLLGTPVLSNQKGVAVLQDGTWKVGDASFCSLLTLENSGKTPSVCKSAG